MKLAFFKTGAVCATCIWKRRGRYETTSSMVWGEHPLYVLLATDLCILNIRFSHLSLFSLVRFSFFLLCSLISFLSFDSFLAFLPPSPFFFPSLCPCFFLISPFCSTLFFAFPLSSFLLFTLPSPLHHSVLFSSSHRILPAPPSLSPPSLYSFPPLPCFASLNLEIKEGE